MRFFLLFFIFLFLVVPAKEIFAQSSIDVPVNDPAYHRVDRLLGYGLIKSVVIGQRPWSRLEFARLIQEARKNLELYCGNEAGKKCPKNPEEATRVLELLEEEFSSEVNESFKEDPFHIEYLDRLLFSFTFLDSPRRFVPFNGTSVNAHLNPLVFYNAGKHFADGWNAHLQIANWAQITPYFVLEATPLLQVNSNKSFVSSDVVPTFQYLYVKGTYKNFEVLIGRDALIWGQGEYGGLLLGSNARPLDLIKVTTPYSFRLPWFFKYLGDNKLAVFVANLGPDQEITYGFFSGFKWTIKPLDWLELAYSQGVMMGGGGAPGGNFWDYFTEFFASRAGFLDSSGAAQTVNLGNRIYGADARLTLPFLHHAQVYYEMFSDDALQSKFTTFWLYSGGIYFPVLPVLNRFALRLEGRFIPIGIYRHSTFEDGWTLNNMFLGDAHGFGNKGALVKVYHEVSQKLHLAYSGEYNVWENDVSLEKRFQLMLDGSYAIRKTISLNGTIGYENVRDFNFTVGDRRNNMLLRVGFDYQLE